jgi:hypothetical protein
MPGIDPDDRSTVVTVEDEPAPEPQRPAGGRVGTAQLLEAIRGIPAATAAAVKGGPASSDPGRPEVTFVGEPEPEPDEEPENDPGGPQAPSTPAVHRARWRHPSARRRRAEAML